jgi:hypothetical protein
MFLFMFDYPMFLRFISICDVFTDSHEYHGVPWDVGHPRSETNVRMSEQMVEVV